MQSEVSSAVEGSFLPEAAIAPLAVSSCDTLLLAARADGTVLLYDLRDTQRAVASLRPHNRPLVSGGNLALGPPLSSQRGFFIACLLPQVLALDNGCKESHIFYLQHVLLDPSQMCRLLVDSEGVLIMCSVLLL